MRAHLADDDDLSAIDVNSFISAYYSHRRGTLRDAVLRVTSERKGCVCRTRREPERESIVVTITDGIVFHPYEEVHTYTLR